MVELRNGSYVWWDRPDKAQEWWNNSDGLPKSIAGRIKSINKEKNQALIIRYGVMREKISELVPLDELRPRSLTDRRNST